jgi:hypothetical protein
MGYNIHGPNTKDLIESSLIRMEKEEKETRRYLQDIEEIRNPSSSPYSTLVHPVLRSFVQRKTRFSQEEIKNEILEDKEQKIEAYLIKIGKTKKDVAEKKLTKKQLEKLTEWKNR